MVKQRSTQGRFSAEGCGLWTKEEHQRFLDALQVYPDGPWKHVAEFVGTRSVRQTMTHAQKEKQKQARHARGLHFRLNTSPEADAPDSTSNVRVGAESVAKKGRKKQKTGSSPTALLETTTTATRMLQSPYTPTLQHDSNTVHTSVIIDEDAVLTSVGTMLLQPTRVGFPHPMSCPTFIEVSPHESSASTTHALDELLSLVGSTQIVWPEHSSFSAFDPNSLLDPKPFKSELWTPADDIGVYEFLARSVM